MHLSKLAAFLMVISAVLAVPVPPGAGVGAGCDAILTDADSGSGVAVKEGLQNGASLVKSAGVKRQGAGVWDGCNAILTDADSGTGLAVKEGLQNGATLIQSAGGKRQLDKMGAGTAAVIGLASPGAADYQEGLTNNIDGDGTSDSALVGQQVGALEVEGGQGAGNLVPNKAPKFRIRKNRRQLDKMGAGTAAVIGLADPDAAAYQEGLTNNIDGDGTSDSAVVGQQVGALEVEAGQGAGNLVPNKAPRSPSIQ